MATAVMPSSLQAQITRRAISPRFATRIFLNMKEWDWTRSAQTHRPCKTEFSEINLSTPLSTLADAKQRHSILDRSSVGDERFGQHTRDFRLDLVHQLHGFDDAQHLSLLNGITDLDEGRRPGRRGFVKCADDGRFHDGQVSVNSRSSGSLRRGAWMCATGSSRFSRYRG